MARSGNDVDMAIRSGGHMWIPGASNADGGVTLDLRGLNTIEVRGADAADSRSTSDHPASPASLAATIVSVGVGATWDAVYAKLDPLGLSVAGGRVGGVGVGGLTLGGGLSFFGPRYGWTCDTVSAFEVVLASVGNNSIQFKSASDLR